MIPQLPKGFSHPVSLGTGGFGSVYRARQIALNRVVALKFIEEKNASTQAQCIKEATTQAELHVQGIPQVYDVHEIGGRICIIMQWIKGCSLRVMLERDMPARFRYTIASEIIRITASLHQRQLAHRDIKPENILISEEGVFLVDFGLAFDLLNDPRQTMSGVVKGTPAYIAPELLRGFGRSSDLQRADLYSMGKVLRELIVSDPLPDCIASCLQESPDLRPHSAIDVLYRWKPDTEGPVSDLSQVAEPYTSETLARQLQESAKALLNRRRYTEAYDLLVECLQIYPESPGALELMNGFPVIRAKKVLPLRPVLTAAGTFLVILVIAGALLIPEKSKFGTANAMWDNRVSHGRSLFMSPQHDRVDESNLSLPLKEYWGTMKTLTGNIVIVSHPSTGSLYLNGKRTDRFTPTLQLPAQAAEHNLIWRKPDGSILWKETVRTLPFETKRICIMER